MNKISRTRLKIRNCREDDIEVLNVLWKELAITHSWRDIGNDVEIQRQYRASYLRSIKEEPQGCFIAVLNGEALGSARAYTMNDYKKNHPKTIGIIGPCVVRKDSRRKGIGKELIESCIEYLKRKGCDYVVIDVYCNNISAMRFYKKLGFQVIGGQFLIIFLQLWVRLGAKPLRMRKLTIRMIKCLI